MEAVSRAVLGLDIGGTKLAVGVVSPDGGVAGFLVEPTRKHEGYRTVIRRLFEMGQRSIEIARSEGVLGAGEAPAVVGISCGGPLDAARGVLTGPLHLPDWIDVPIVAMAEETFGVPAALENDATAAAYGEYCFGAGRGTSTMIYLTVSTGVGGGSVINGRLHRGAAGNGGEFGHIQVRPGGRPGYGKRAGTLEAYASGTAIAQRAAEAVAALSEVGGTSALSALTVVRAEDVTKAAREGDPLAKSIWDETTELLAAAITDLVNILEPDLVVLGGGVTRAGDMLLDPVRAGVLADAMPPAAAAVRIELAQLGDTVGVVGAGAIALDHQSRIGFRPPTPLDAHV
ncbi:ROK family protein [Herbiconiux sp. L3-i23]|uniref:ROK family protein n=1 Tax=Herbiconiux sp. L3-i23 TaxID=2905871 RepID=UPI002068E196|nr:ROK family protein [Herbiconiux sp. L3-i23]BDI21732.1 N-acylmannosamine kinase [Herbiconiux sp. L3-i23]